jgi:hypothetical protein
LCDQRTVVVETFDQERVSVDSGEVAAYLETFGRFEEAAVFGNEVRELLLRMMKEFRVLGDAITP